MNVIEFTNLTPRVENKQKIKLLVHGNEGIMITLFLQEGQRVAVMSMFIGLPMYWEVEGDKLIIRTTIDALDMEYIVQRAALSELV